MSHSIYTTASQLGRTWRPEPNTRRQRERRATVNPESRPGAGMHSHAGWRPTSQGQRGGGGGAIRKSPQGPLDFMNPEAAECIRDLVFEELEPLERIAEQ